MDPSWDSEPQFLQSDLLQIALQDPVYGIDWS